MTSNTGNIIADSLQFSVNYAKRLLTGVTAEQFARLAAPGGVIIHSNHAAFTLGHLSLYAPRIIEQVGQDATGVAPTPEFVSLFSKEAQCVDDPQGAIYPSMEVVTVQFFDSYGAAIDALRTADDSMLLAPNPVSGRMGELFPTIGSVQNFYASGHLLIHLGQMSAWRRALGLPPA